MKNLLIIFFVLTSISAFAESGKVLLLRGEAKFNGQALTDQLSITGKGTLTTSPKSFVKILLVDSGTTLIFGANSQSELDLSVRAEQQEVSLIKGIARWITGKNKGLGIKTPNAIMGIRGTDFSVSYNPLLGETEVVCFDGSIQLINASDVSDSKSVSKNQWGGIGGRFGKKLAPVLSLSEALLTELDSLIPNKTTGQ